MGEGENLLPLSLSPCHFIKESQLDLQNIVTRLCATSRIVALTGAGVSAESGIPTFRDAQTGLWAQYDPTELATPEAFARNPKLVCDWYVWRRELCADKQPNLGHSALAEFEKLFPGFVLVTQNIDGLHQCAGSREVIELHGNLARDKCSRENIVMSRDDQHMRNGLFTCARCGAYLRPDVVWFGESLPSDALERAIRAAMQCDVLLTIGTSALVEPAASLPRIAKRAKAFVVEINPDETPVSSLANVVVREKSGVALPALFAEIKSKLLTGK